MNEIKRKLNTNSSLIIDKMLKLSIENLSNDIFYEVFDYLDGCAIYQAFSNLNYRFEQLLHSSLNLFKIRLNFAIEKKDVMFINHWKQIIRDHRQQILSMNIIMRPYMHGFFFSFTIDSSLNHLESLVLQHIPFVELLSVLLHLNSLPRLYSLTIHPSSESTNLTVIYQIILKLSKLKYYKLTSNTSDSLALLPRSTYQEFSSIEHLVIDHHYTFKQISILLSYTPQIRHLSLKYPEDNHLNHEPISTIHLSNLTNLSMEIFYLTFDRFELFIKNQCFQLKILSVRIENNIDYLDGNRWKQIIVQYLSKLEKFSLKFYDYADEDYQYPIYSKGGNQFTSSFWIEHQWFFEVETSSECITYSIGPYKKRWYDTSMKLIKSTRLILDDITDEDNYKYLIKDIQRILTIENIYHLEIPDEQLPTDVLIRIVNLFPELISLKIDSLSLTSLQNCSTKITKIYLEQMNDIMDIYCLMSFCPYMTYLKIDYVNDIDINWCLKKILEKIQHDSNQYLRLLSFYLSNQEHNRIKDLITMLNSQQLIVDYTIQRIDDWIYLQWK